VTQAWARHVDMPWLISDEVACNCVLVRHSLSDGLELTLRLWLCSLAVPPPPSGITLWAVSTVTLLDAMRSFTSAAFYLISPYVFACSIRILEKPSLSASQQGSEWYESAGCLRCRRCCLGVSPSGSWPVWSRGCATWW
jgi:hypothetical protein